MKILKNQTKRAKPLAERESPTLEHRMPGKILQTHSRLGGSVFEHTTLLNIFLISR